MKRSMDLAHGLGWTSRGGCDSTQAAANSMISVAFVSNHGPKLRPLDDRKL